MKDFPQKSRRANRVVHSPHEIISTVYDFPYKIIEKCFQENALNITLMAK